VGSILQFGVQLPTALKLVPKLKLGFSLKLKSVRDVIRSFFPVVIGRGVVQFSAYIDNILASFLPMGAVSALGYAQSIYTLPVSLFGMSVSAAELPAMSSAYGSKDLEVTLRNRINAALRKIAFLVVPSVVGFLILGDVVAGLLYQTGEFNQKTSHYVWGILAGSSVGLLATTLGRLYSSAFYSLRDTRTPLRYSIIRVILTTGLGYLMGLRLAVWIGVNPSWGTAGLTASAGIAGWVEFYLLRRGINQRIGETGLPLGLLTKLWGSALFCGAIGFALKQLFSGDHPAIRGTAIILIFVVLYFGLTAALGIEESKQFTHRILVKLKIKAKLE
jgi:putative peptidoglycan lipid II flippase